MSEQEDRDIVHSLNKVDEVVSDPLRFKARLEIGEEAYTSLSLKNKAFELWDVVGMAMTGASVAKSAVVASTFFSTTTSSFFGLVGVTTAVTPIGWVIAASVATGGAYYGVVQLYKNFQSNRVEVVPKFINTPLDVLAVGLADLFLPLSLKVAAADGRISEEEREVIRDHLVENWGYNRSYVDASIQLFERHIEQYTLKELTRGLREFTKDSPDCNHQKVRRRFINLLNEIASADGHLHEMEELTIDHIADQLPKDPWFRRPSFPNVSLPKIEPPTIRMPRLEGLWSSRKQDEE